MRALAWDEPLVWVTWKVVAVPAGASFHETVKVTPFWVAVAEWASPVCDVAGIAAGVGLAWVRRDGAGAVVAVSVAAVVASALSVLAVLVLVDVAVLSSTVSAAAFVLAPSSALPVSMLVASACACCSVVARG